jgi:hypothetical protein
MLTHQNAGRHFVDTDESGRVKLDCNPRHFQYVLDHLWYVLSLLCVSYLRSQQQLAVVHCDA